MSLEIWRPFLIGQQLQMAFAAVNLADQRLQSSGIIAACHPVPQKPLLLSSGPQTIRTDDERGIQN